MFLYELVLVYKETNYSVKQRIQTVFGSQIANSMTEFGSSFRIPIIDPDSSFSLSQGVSGSFGSSSDSHSQEQKVTDLPQVEFNNTAKCEWNYQIPPTSSSELCGCLTGFVTRIGSSNNSSDRGNTNLGTHGNAAKQLIFLNGRLIEYKKVDLIEGYFIDFGYFCSGVERIRASYPPCACRKLHCTSVSVRC